MIHFSELPAISKGKLVRQVNDYHIRHFAADSRKAILNIETCFFAISGSRNDGHHYITELYKKGIRQFVVERDLDWNEYTEAAFFVAPSALQVLQDIASHHRKQFNIPVVGIAGSNAKTIVKEWLYQLISPTFNTVKNPGSYNSQLGVPLSVLMMQPGHQFGIFEAGISQPGEMIHLQKIIQPTLGVFTNIGPAHDSGFKNRKQKIQEKLLLFKESKAIVYCSDHEDVHTEIKSTYNNKVLLAWGTDKEAAVRITSAGDKTTLTFGGKAHQFNIPFTDPASKENLTHCIVLLLHLGISNDLIQERINSLAAVPMRLEMKQGINQSLIIDDTYNNDIAGLQISLDFLASQQKQNKTLILSDILQSGNTAESLVGEIAELVKHAGVTTLYGIGPELSRHHNLFQGIQKQSFFESTEAFMQSFNPDDFQASMILVKGARTYKFEQIVHRLERKVHGTVMEIDLNAVVHNLNFFKARLKPGVNLMVMVKAFAYGSGSEEVANLLQYHKVNYLGVAYADEGVDLRKNRITLPIMVMNPSEESFNSLLQYDLEPEIYSMKILRSYIAFLASRPGKIHLKIDSGMHRLGFEPGELGDVMSLLKQNPNLHVASVFTHLAGSDEKQHDDFSKNQIEVFLTQYNLLEEELGIHPMRHALNSAGILRFPEYQFEMVRLGIGLYGVDPTEEPHKELIPVATLKTVISQVKKIPAGETIGYGRKGKATKAMTLATIAIGYADGFSRSFSNGAGIVMVNGARVPVVGNVCMDMTMIDVTDAHAREGDEVIIFGKNLPIGEVAGRINTISYEVLTSTSERVKRVFHAESI